MSIASDGGWIGVDLDGTLAEYSTWISADHIGKPIPGMVARVKRWLEEGTEVRILTARVSGNRPSCVVAEAAIRRWCKEHIGRELEVTCTKDWMMLELWDDRAVQVIKDTGETLVEQLGKAQSKIQELEGALDQLRAEIEYRTVTPSTAPYDPTNRNRL